MGSHLKSTSKFLCLALRHKPEVLDLELDPNGWVDVDVLLRACAAKGCHLTRKDLDHIVETNDKKRFAYSHDGKRIRANQGHSLSIDLALEPSKPPDKLYHGTATKSLQAILAEGLKPMTRDHVHLSSTVDTAITVGRRHGRPIVLVVDAKRMSESGNQFWVSDNGVWLTDHIPPQFIQILDF